MNKPVPMGPSGIDRALSSSGWNSDSGMEDYNKAQNLFEENEKEAKIIGRKRKKRRKENISKSSKKKPIGTFLQ